MDLLDDDHPEATPQQVFYGMLAWCDYYGMTDVAERMRQAGPPAPLDRDGYWGRITFYEHHASNNPEWARLLEQLKADGPPPDDSSPLPVASDGHPQ